MVLIFTVIKGYQANRLDQEVPEFKIDDLFDVPGVKTVARGLVTQGIIVENMPLNIGPFEEGSSKTVSSIKWHKAFSRDGCGHQSSEHPTYSVSVFTGNSNCRLCCSK